VHSEQASLVKIDRD